MKNLKWTIACLVAAGLLVGTGCSKQDEKIGKLEAKIEALEKQNAAGGTTGTAAAPAQANMNIAN